MENTNVVEVNEEVTEVTTVEETNSKKGLGKAGIAALVVAGGVGVFMLGKKAWNKWVKPGIQKRKAKKAVAETDEIDVESENAE